MSKRLKFFLAILAFFVSVFCALILSDQLNFPFFQIKNKEDATGTAFSPQENSLNPSEPGKFSESVNPSEPGKFSLPVNKKYLEKAIFDGDNNKFLFFDLEPGELIKPIFSGEVVEIIENQKLFEKDLGDNVELNTILIKDKNDKFLASYVFAGSVSVELGEEISVKSILGEIGYGEMKFHEATNFFLYITDDENNAVELSKEIFE